MAEMEYRLGKGGWDMDVGTELEQGAIKECPIQDNSGL